MRLWVKFIFLAIVLSEINQVYSQTCKPITVTENIDDPYVAQALKRDLIRQAWNNPQHGGLSKLVTELKNVILDMSESDSFFFSELAGQLTAIFTAMLGEGENIYPNLCPFASVINKTAKWHETKKPDKYIRALKETIKTVPTVLSYLTHVSLVSLGCTNVSNPCNENTQSCYQNGLVSNIEVIWKNDGRLLPWTLREVAILLSDSPLFVERAYATLLTYVITAPQQFIYLNYNYGNLFEVAKHYTSSVNDSKCCCEERRNRLIQLNTVIAEEAKANGEAKIEELRKC